ncbi:MAG: RtcB family protein [Bdellovibrionota bacterium]
MPIKTVLDKARVPVKIWTELSSLEEDAAKQLLNTANLPFVFKHVAAMPDVHLGKGATIGSVVATKGAIVPAAVGVDIGCGMCAVKLPFTADALGGDQGLRRLRNSIERSIPTGPEGNREVSTRAGKAFKALGKPVALDEKTKAVKNAAYQLGSLGGGNHFIEICVDKDSNAWLMLHSGSRNVGKCLAEEHIRKAKWLMQEMSVNLADPDLAYFLENTPEFQSYLHDLMWAQDYAKANRNEMMLKILKDLSHHVYGEDRGAEALTVTRVDCHHNYVAREVHFGEKVFVTRKGAVRAQAGDLGIVPGSMGTRSYIVRGLGNPEAFHSCSHGAGRRMSRGEAKRRFSVEDLRSQTAGVECRKDTGVLDEVPGAYKDIDEVMANQNDLVEVVAELKQIVCVKG